MDDLFTKRVRAAAAAGWWTLLIVYCFLVLWLLYLLLMSRQPSWMLTLLGEGVTWPIYQTFWIWAIFVFKIGFWLMTSVVVWLTIWGRRLSRLKEKQ